MSRAGPWALSLDAIFELLCRRRRRYALYVLYRNGECGMTLQELASRIHRLDDKSDGDTRKKVLEVLRDEHLPRLVETRVVDFDERSGAIRYRGQPSLEEWVEHAEFKEGKHPESTDGERREE